MARASSKSARARFHMIAVLPGWGCPPPGRFTSMASACVAVDEFRGCSCEIYELFREMESFEWAGSGFGTRSITTEGRRHPISASSLDVSGVLLDASHAPLNDLVSVLRHYGCCGALLAHLSFLQRCWLKQAQRVQARGRAIHSLRTHINWLPPRRRQSRKLWRIPSRSQSEAAQPTGR